MKKYGTGFTPPPLMEISLLFFGTLLLASIFNLSLSIYGPILHIFLYIYYSLLNYTYFLPYYTPADTCYPTHHQFIFWFSWKLQAASMKINVKTTSTFPNQMLFRTRCLAISSSRLQNKYNKETTRISKQINAFPPSI